MATGSFLKEVEPIDNESDIVQHAHQNNKDAAKYSGGNDLWGSAP